MTDARHAGPTLERLTLESRDSDHASDGFHRRHAATPENLPAIARAFADASFFLEMMTCEDRRRDLDTMRLVYTFNRFLHPQRHLITVDLPPDLPGASAPSIASICPAANWFEREVFDMYGVSFSDHPNLKRILLPDDADFHALLKDFGRIEDATQTDQ